MQITLSYFSLTKIVEFTPFHLINNNTEVKNILVEPLPLKTLLELSYSVSIRLSY